MKKFLLLLLTVLPSAVGLRLLFSCQSSGVLQAPERLLHEGPSKLLPIAQCINPKSTFLALSRWEDQYFSSSTEEPAFLFDENTFLYAGFFGYFKGHYCLEVGSSTLYLEYTYQTQNYLSAYSYNLETVENQDFLNLHLQDSNDNFGYLPSILILQRSR